MPLSNNPLADDPGTLEPTSLPPPATSSKEGSRVVAMALLPGNPGDASRCIYQNPKGWILVQKTTNNRASHEVQS